ncbi:MAG: hypothetical protein ABIR24_13315 [Verrucomicrobiota bacterium]
MKNSILLVALSILVCGCETYRHTEPQAVLIELRGTPGLKFHGTYSIDGKEQAVCGTIPMDIETDGRKFYSIFRKEGDGALTVILNKNCQLYGEATSVTENGGVQAKISPGEVFDLTSVTGF